MLVSILAACSSTASAPEPLAQLPEPAPVETDRFRDPETCAQCHLVGEDKSQLHDAMGANVSPVLLWRSSMMGLAARDPFYLAVFAEELEYATDKAAVEKTCTRCHAPAGSEELAVEGGHLTFEELTSGTSPAAILGRSGVTCTLCHQIAATNLGDERSFSGNFTVGYQRLVYGPYSNPTGELMSLIANFTPTQGTHVQKSELCATCHTVIVGDVVEQATYLEWRSSSFKSTLTCQSCHVPTIDELGNPITTQVAGVDNLLVRTPVGRHVFVGGNAYMLELMADAVDWLGAKVSADELRAAARGSVDHLETAAALQITKTADGFSVRVTNQTGHKLPTGYPSRRIWLHVTIEQAGTVIYESGRVDARGSLVDSTGKVLPRQPHRDEILSQDEVQVWEATLVDRQGRPTHRALDARRYDKDDRILPAGYAPSSIDSARTAPVAVISDPTFLPGVDTVTYKTAVPAGATIRAELQYQSLSPEIVDAIAEIPTAASERFVPLARKRPQLPTTIARSSLVY